ncbi:DKNYY domain-containing protein [Spirosoma foliorum]|uniref:DKNYY domain-containing protein n=2 Tax=Spirosoma foliorum TaxID=2710596 RepID=A0A7G5H7D5_9BACT|nr:DKNYY domain-containing protein [Spirosoma foliorum]
MKSLHILLSILGLGFLISCKKSGYETRDGSVYYKDYLLREADYASFEVLNDLFAKDKKHAYYRGISLTDADGASFLALNDHYGKDKTMVFYCDNYLDFKLFETKRKDKISRIYNADASTFEVLESSEYAKDKNRCYNKDIGFAVSDLASFQPLDYGYGKDNVTGYFNLKPIPGSHGRSFTVLSANYSKDKQHVYYTSRAADGPPFSDIHRIPLATPDSFTVIGMYYATDQVHAFYKDHCLPAAAPASFRQWNANEINYARDSTHIYFQEKLIMEADKASFHLLTDFYAQDANAVFYEHRPLSASDITTFTVLGLGYAKDANQVYYEGKLLKKADPVSFALVDNDADRDAADKYYSYKDGHRIKPE